MALDRRKAALLARHAREMRRLFREFVRRNLTVEMTRIATL